MSQRRNNNNTNNNGRRRNNNRTRRPNFRANLPAFGAQSATRPDDKVEKRVFSRNLLLNLTQTDGSKSYQNYHCDDYLSRYTGTENMTGAYDLYKYTKIEVFARISFNHTSVQSDTLASQQSALNSTSIISAIDTDSSIATVSDEINSYTNAKEAALGRAWRRVAIYTPHIRAADLSMISANPVARWLTTTQQSVTHIGYQCHVYNTSGTEFFGALTSNAQEVEFKVRAHVSFKGRRSTSTNTVTSRFYQNFIGSTVTVNPATGPPMVKTVDTYREHPDPADPSRPLFQFRWVGSTIWLPISFIVDVVRTGQLGGNPADYDGPKIPERFYLTNWDAPVE